MARGATRGGATCAASHPARHTLAVPSYDMVGALPAVRRSPQTAMQFAAGPAVPSAALRFIKYVEASPSPFHAAATSAAVLEKAGFTKLHESQPWDGRVHRGGKY